MNGVNMNTKIIYLFNLHSGLKSDMPSDTLWGNLCWAIKFLYGDDELKNFLSTYQTYSPALIISSSFPFYKKEDNIIRFFPRPILPIKPFEIIQKENENKLLCEKVADIIERKKKKDIQFLEESFFLKIINGEATYDNIETVKHPKVISNSITRNTIDRIRGGTLKLNDTGQLFTEDEYFIHFETDEGDSIQTGLFFLVKDNTEGKLEAALRLLSHIGIGGNRSIGKGVFDFSIEDYEITEPANANAMTNLSLYYPIENELEQFQKNDYLFNYHLEQRRGYFGVNINGQYQKNSITYFKEGSVFPYLDKELFGQNKIFFNAQIYDVHQYGFGFMLKMKL